MPARGLGASPNVARKALNTCSISRVYVCSACRYNSPATLQHAVRQYSASNHHSQRILRGPKLWAAHVSIPRETGSKHHRSTFSASRERLNSTSSTTPSPRPITSVNSSPRVAPAVSNLYNALRKLESVAANFVNLGRLKLAIRSLEDNGVIRVGLLVLKHGSRQRPATQLVARDLAGAVLADVLSDKQPWEGLLEQQDSRAILIKPGSTLEAKDSNSVFRTIYADAPLLRTHNIEILISTLDIDVAKTMQDEESSPGQEDLLDAILVPRLETFASSAGGYSSVGYPIHKALLLGQTTDDILALGLYARTLGITSLPPELIKVAINDSDLVTRQTQPLDSSESSPEQEGSSMTSVIDTSLAREAIALMRSSMQNSAAYQHGWDTSGVARIVEWVTNSPHADSKLDPTLQMYITDLLVATSVRIRRAEAELHNQSKSDTVSDVTRQSISKAVNVWAEAAHRELRDSLDLAFSSKQWHKLSWWKLSWRVDEVGIVLEELLERAWLTYAEKGMIFLAGRVQETGILQRKAWESSIQTVESSLPPQDGSHVTVPQSDQILQPINPAPAVLRSENPEDARDTSFTTLDIPYPQHIPAARRALILSTVPDMHALAQRLVLTNLSTTALTSALSALYYVSFPLTTLYEAGAIAALGLVFGLKRMQNQWQRAQEDWQLAVRDEGRRALMATEESVRSLIEKGGAPVVDDVLLKEIEDAKLLVAEAQSALRGIATKA